MKKIIISTIFLMFILPSFAQLAGQGELLNNKALELAISQNRKSGRETYQNIYSNYHFIIDLKQHKVDIEALLKSINSISGVLESSFNQAEMKLIVVTQKTDGNTFEPLLKQQIDINHGVISSITELTYKK